MSHVEQKIPRQPGKNLFPSIFCSPKPPILTTLNISLNEGIPTHPQSEFVSVHASRSNKKKEFHLDGLSAAGPTLEWLCGFSVIRAPSPAGVTLFRIGGRGGGSLAPDRSALHCRVEGRRGRCHPDCLTAIYMSKVATRCYGTTA